MNTVGEEAGPEPRKGGGISRFWLGLAAVAVGSIGVAAIRSAEPKPEPPMPVLHAVAAAAPSFPTPDPVLAAMGYALPPRPDFGPVEATVAGLDPLRLEEVVSAVRREIEAGRVPGGALVMGRGSRVVAKYGIGLTSGEGRPVVPDETIYDLASLTKVVATTTAVMLLIEDGKLDLDDRVSTFLPEFLGGRKGDVTIRHLMTHTSGLPAGMVLPDGPREVALAAIAAAPLRWRPGQRVEYSDLGPILLYEAAERAAGEPLEHLLHRRVFLPLGMTRTGFNPTMPCARCAPTSPTIHVYVHDPLAQRLGGVAGNAGLFSTATDIGRFAAMLAGGGELGGVRILEAETIAEFARRQPGAATRALGWDTPDPAGVGAGGERISPRAFGHTGFTGTSLWIDPDRGTWVVLLTNRTLVPRAPNQMQELRRAVNDRLADAVDFLVND